MIDNINPTQQPELSEQDAELLSAYIDDMLPIDERRVLETRLDNEPFLQRELSALHQTVAWVNALPTLKAPRDFTISEEDIALAPQKIIQMPQRNNWLMASVAAIIIVIIGVTAILPELSSSSPASDMAQEQVAFANTAPAIEAESEADGVNAVDDFSADSAEEVAPVPEIARNADPEAQAQEASGGIDSSSSQPVQPPIVMSGQGSAPENTSSNETLGIVQAESETANYDADNTASNNTVASSAVMEGSADDEILEEAETEDMQDSVSDMPEADTVMMDTLDISPVQRTIMILTDWLAIIREIFALIQS